MAHRESLTAKMPSPTSSFNALMLTSNGYNPLRSIPTFQIIISAALTDLLELLLNQGSDKTRQYNCQNTILASLMEPLSILMTASLVVGEPVSERVHTYLCISLLISCLFMIALTHVVMVGLTCLTGTLKFFFRPHWKLLWPINISRPVKLAC